MPAIRKSQTRMKKAAPATARATTTSRRAVPPRTALRATARQVKHGAIMIASAPASAPQRTKLVSLDDPSVSGLTHLSLQRLTWWMKQLGAKYLVGRPPQDVRGKKNRMIWAIQAVRTEAYQALSPTTIARMVNDLGSSTYGLRTKRACLEFILHTI